MWSIATCTSVSRLKLHARLLSSSTLSSASHATKKASWARRSFTVIKYSYATLALIPTTFSLASLTSLVAFNDKPRARAFALWAWTGWLAIPLSWVLLAVAPVSLLLDPIDRTWLDSIQRAWARWTIWPFLNITVQNKERGLELLREEGKGCVVVSNHRSMLDVFVLFATLDIPLRFVSKKEIFYIPLVGWVMGIIGHVSLIRGDKSSGKSVLENCKYYLQNGKTWSVVFFAEGSRTRSLDESEMNDFRIGAFRLAESVHSAVLPVSISGTGKAMPPGKEFSYLGTDAEIIVRIQEPLMGDLDAEVMRKRCFDEIQTSLRKGM